MDPKLSQLDPQLREAYQRVLNGKPSQGQSTPTPQSTTQPNTNPVQPPPSPVSQQYQPQVAQPQIHSEAQTVVAPQMHTPSPVGPTPQANPAVATGPVQSQPMTSQPLAQNLGGTVAFNAATASSVVKKGEGRKITHVLLVVGAVFFLLAYTFMWIWIFKIKVPFLPV